MKTYIDEIKSDFNLLEAILERRASSMVRQLLKAMEYSKSTSRLKNRYLDA